MTSLGSPDAAPRRTLAQRVARALDVWLHERRLLGDEGDPAVRRRLGGEWVRILGQWMQVDSLPGTATRASAREMADAREEWP